jgi:hypothetical protein
VALSLSLALGGPDKARLAATLFVVALLPFYALVVWWGQRRRQEPATVNRSRPWDGGQTVNPPTGAGITAHATIPNTEQASFPADNPAPLNWPRDLSSKAGRAPVGPAVFGTALLFGMLHVGVWPTPIALFVLGLGLGWLAWRTQSLVGPIVLHSLFNAVGSLRFLSP